MANPPPAPAPQMTLKVWGMLILLSLIWGGSFVFGRIAVLEVPPLTLVLARVGLAALALNIFLFIRPVSTGQTKGNWLNFTIMGLINNIIPFTLIFYGQKEIGAGLAAIVNGMTPMWTLIFAHFTTSDERISAPKIVGIILGLVGVTVLIGPDAVDGLTAPVFAQLLVLGATISYGLGSVFGKRFAKTPPIQTARGQLTTSTLMMMPIAFIVDTPWALSAPSLAAITSIVLLALVCTAYAYILYFKILAQAGALNVALVTLLIPPSAMILGMIFLAEFPDKYQLLGLGLILAGLLTIDGRLTKIVFKTELTHHD